VGGDPVSAITDRGYKIFGHNIQYRGIAKYRTPPLCSARFSDNCVMAHKQRKRPTHHPCAALRAAFQIAGV
jgi:hypothetical protein